MKSSPIPLIRTPGSEIQFRPLRESDSISELTALLHAAYRPLSDAGMKFVASYQDEERTLKRCSKGETIIADLNGRIIGTVTLATPENTGGTPWYNRPFVASFGQFAVHPDFQNLGLGSKLLDWAENRATDLGIPEIACDTSENAIHLIAIYKKRGYRFIEFTQWNEVNYRSVILSKNLTSIDISSIRPSTQQFHNTESHASTHELSRDEPRHARP